MLNEFRRRLRQMLSTHPRSSRRRNLTCARPLEALEDRICLSNINFQPSGDVVFGGGNANNDLQISVTGNTYTFSDPNETINIIGGNEPLTQSGSGTNTVTFDITTVPGAAVQEFIINLNGGDDTTTVNSFRPGAEGLEIRDDAGEGTDTVNINGDIGTMASPVATDGVQISAEQINLSADIFVNNLDILLGESGGATPITLTGDTELGAGTGTVVVNSGATPNDLTGNNTDLTITADSVQLLGSIALAGTSNVSITANGLLQIGSGGPASLAAGGDITLVSSSPITLNDVLGAAGDISITSPDTNMGGAAGTITGNSLSISGNLTSTSGNLTFLTATGGDVVVGGKIASSTVTTISALTGNIDLDGTVEGTAVTVTTNTGTINAVAFVGTIGDVTITGPTTLDNPGPALIKSGGVLTFSSTVTGSGFDLNLTAPTLISVGGAITNVQNLTVQDDGVNDVDVALGNVTARQIVVNAGVGGTGSITLNGDLAATALGGGLVGLVGPVIVTGANRSVTSGGGAAQNIFVNGTIDGASADTTNLLLDAGTMGNVMLTPGNAIGGSARLESLAVRGDTIQLRAINVNTDLTVNGGDIQLLDTVTGGGTGTALFAPAVVGGTMDIFNDPANTRVGTNTRIASDTLADIAPGAFADFQFGDAATMILRIHPDANNAVPAGALALSTPTEFQATAIIVSEDLDQGANTLTFETDNLAIYRVAAGTGDVVINKKTPGGTLELRGNLAAKTNWGTNAITINAVGATVNAPAAGAPLPILGLGANQPQVNLGGPNASLTINADTLNALASSAIVSSGLLELNVDTLNLTGGVQTVGVGTVTIGNPGAAVENIGGGPFSILLPAGSDMSLEDYDGNGGSLNIRGVGGQLGTVTLGAITDTGALSLGTSASNDATILNLTDDITAGSIVLRGDGINLDGDLTSTSGNIQLFGPVTLTGDSSLTNTSGLATGLIQFNGTVDGGFALVIDAGPGAALFSHGVGQVTALDSMTLVTGGVNYVTVPITVVNGFTWTVGVAGNGVNDRIIRAGAGSITSTSGIVTLTADKLQGFTAGVNVSNPNVLTERGAGD